MEGKKISFGFTKTKKAEKPVLEEKKDYIECVEGKSIKVLGGEEIKENTPLVIPMKPNTLVTAERLKEIAEKVESALIEPETTEKPPTTAGNAPENETLDQMAVRELLQDTKKEAKLETTALTVPLPAKPVNEGKKESTLDDYEAVPIQDFGMAMLRGMGWTPNKEKSTYKPPQLRPKGLGLGADKVVKDNQKQKSAKNSKEEELMIVKNAYVKITSGKYSGYYGKVVSLDEDNGRVMVDITVKKETVSLSEFMMHPVTKSEFDKGCKVINAGSYEDYKKKETTQKSSRITEKESTAGNSTNNKNNSEDTKYTETEATSSKSDKKYDREEISTKERSTKNGKESNSEDRRERDRYRSHRSRQRRDSTEEKSTRRKHKKYSSNESLDSLSDTERRSHKKKERKRYSSQDSLSSQSESDRKRNKKKDRRKRDSSESESDHRSKRNKTPEGKRDIDKKRKGKKKKRDRDRSPNYRKHRK